MENLFTHHEFDLNRDARAGVLRMLLISDFGGRDQWIPAQRRTRPMQFSSSNRVSDSTPGATRSASADVGDNVQALRDDISSLAESVKRLAADNRRYRNLGRMAVAVPPADTQRLLRGRRVPRVVGKGAVDRGPCR